MRVGTRNFRSLLAFACLTLASFAAPLAFAQASHPTIDFATYIGSELTDGAVALETDASGSIYLFGAYPSTASHVPFALFTQFSLSSPVPAGSPNCFLAKMTPTGNGGVNLDYAAILTDSIGCDAMTLSPAGEVFTARRDGFGQTWIESFVFSGGLVTRSALFLLDPMGKTAQLRADGHDFVYALGLCAQEFEAGDLWPLPNGAQPDPLPGYCRNPNATGSSQSQYLLMVTNSAGQFAYGTFVTGPASQSEASALQIDSSGRAYIAGLTSAALLSVTANAFQPQRGDTGCGSACPGDAFLIAVDPSQTGAASLVYASYFGGSGSEHNIAMVLDAQGAVYLSGNTQSPDFPHGTNPGLNVPAVFLSKLDISQNPAAQLIYTVPTVESAATTVSNSRMRLLPGPNANPHPRIALLVTTSDATFPLVQPVFSAPVNPNAQPPSLPFKPVLLVFDPAEKTIDFATFLSETQLVSDEYLAFGPTQNAIIASVTTETTSSTDGSVPRGQSDVRLFSISGLPAVNTPPAIQAPADITVQAPSALGAFVVFQVSASDAQDGNLTPTCSPTSGSLFPIGVTTVTCSVTDSGGLTTNATFHVTVNPPPPNTAVGTNVVVSPIDEISSVYLGVYQPVTLTFGTVTMTGTTRLSSRYDVTPPPPDGLQAGSPPIYFDLSTTALYDAAAGIAMCIDIRGMSLANPAGISIYQLQGAAWVSLAASITPGSQVCTHTGSLGTYAIFYPAVPETRINTIAGTGFGRGAIDGPGGDPRDDANDGGPATAAALIPLTATLDRASNLLYVSDVSVFPDPSGVTSRVRRIDLSTGIIDAVPGTDVTNFLIRGMALDSSGNLYFATGCDVRKKNFTSGDVTVVAGTGVCGFSGDGLSAVQAQISPLNGQLAIDRFDNLFIADSSNARIRRVDGVTGIISTVAGDGTFRNPDSGSPPTLTGFGGATGLAIDNQGYLLIANILQVMRVSPGTDGMVNGGADEVLTVIAGCVTNCIAPFAGDGGPISDPKGMVSGTALSVASDGAVLVTDQMNSRIRRIDPGADHVVTGASDEIVWTVAGFSYPITNGTGIFNGDTFSTQSNLALPGFALEDAAGNLLIIDTNNSRVRLTGYSPSIVGRASSLADLAIAATATPNPVEVGSVLTYGPISLTNNGPATATAVTLNFPLPSSVNFESVTTGQGSCTSPAVGSSGTVRCNLGSIASGGTVTVSVAVKPQSVGPLIATLSVGGTETDPNHSNNSTSVSTTVNLPPPAEINVVETITVSDSVNVLPSALIGVSENIKVTDSVDLPDHTAPIVTPPANISVVATEAGGARGNVPLFGDSRRLHDFLVAGSAVDDRDPSPVRLAPQIVQNGAAVDATDTTLFPVGETTVVTFRFKDASGNIGTATASVFVRAVIGGIVKDPGVPVTATDPNNVPQPVQGTFSSVLQPGLLIATVMLNPPQLPIGFTAVTPIYDLITTALYSGPVDVTLLGTNFTQLDHIYHFENDTWVDVTTFVNPSAIGGRVSSLSPFVVLRPVNRPPTASASAPATVEATSSAGASVTFSGTGSDPDNDPLTFSWSSATCGSAAGQTATLLCPLGTNSVTLTVSDGRGGAATSTVNVTVRDTTSPAISITPSQITVLVNSVPATRAALGLPAPVVTDVVDAHPRVTDNAPATFTTGTYAIVFTATDASGNSSTATLTVNVQLRLTVLNAAVAVAQFQQPDSDILAAELTLRLGPGNNGINPATDVFHFLAVAGTVTLPVDIPLSRFTSIAGGGLFFKGQVNGLPTDVVIKPLGLGKYFVVLTVSKANLSGFRNPANIEIALGSDFGSTVTSAAILKK